MIWGHFTYRASFLILVSMWRPFALLSSMPNYAIYCCIAPLKFTLSWSWMCLKNASVVPLEQSWITERQFFLISSWLSIRTIPCANSAWVLGYRSFTRWICFWYLKDCPWSPRHSDYWPWYCAAQWGSGNNQVGAYSSVCGGLLRPWRTVLARRTPR